MVGWIVNAQTTMIKGQILDESRQQGVPFALVKINNSYAYADERGYFEAEVNNAETFSLQASQLGFETATLIKTFDQLHNIKFFLKAKAVTLEEITVSEQPMHCNPQSDIICDHAKQTTQPRDIGDLFKEIPGFSVVKKGGFAMDPVFRSFKYEQLNIIYDGGIQTTHACPARMDPATTHVNPDQVQKIELIKGPFSVRYGAAMGATINIVTETWNRDESGISGYLEGGYETNGNSKLTQFQIQSNKRLDLLLSGGLKEFGSYESGDGTEVPSSFRAYDYSFKAGYDLGENQRLQMNWRQSLSRDVLHAGLAMDTDTDDTYIFSIDYNWKNISPLLYGVTAKAYGTRVDHVMSNLRRPNAMMMEMVSNVRADTYGGRAEATLMPGKKILVYAGLDYRYLWRDGQGLMTMKRNMMGEPLPMPMTTVTSSWQNSTIQTGGAFAEGRWFANPKWTILLGIRADVTTAEIKEPAADFKILYGDLNADAQWTLGATTSATYKTPSDWTFQFALGRGTRTANMIERFINHFNVGRDPYEYVGNPFLKPEVNNQAEFSVSQKAERFSISSNIFYSYLTNYITAAVDTTIRARSMTGPMYARRFENIDAATQWGMELGVEWQVLKNFTATGNVAFTRSQNLDWQEPLAEIPPLSAMLSVRYARERWWVDARGRFADNQDRISGIFAETTTPGFSVYDLRAGLEPLRDVLLGVAVLNIFDRQYREHLNRAYRNMPTQGVIYEPGRNITLFAKYRF